jgi:hypothetical protein
MGTPIAKRLESLESANDRRLARVAILRKLEGGRLDPFGLIVDPPDPLAGMFVFDFLWHVPRIGRATIRDLNKVAIRNQINLAVSLAELSVMRRFWLAERLPPSARRGPSVLASRPQG